MMKQGLRSGAPVFLFSAFARIAGEALLRHGMAFWSHNNHGKVPALEELRARYDTLFARFGTAVEGMAFTSARLGAIDGEWVGASRDGRVILYFHGGGFIAGSPQSHRPLISRLVEACGIGAFSVDYRLAPEGFFPAAV